MPGVPRNATSSCFCGCEPRATPRHAAAPCAGRARRASGTCEPAFVPWNFCVGDKVRRPWPCAPSARVRPAPVYRRWCSPVDSIGVGTPRCRALLAVSRVAESRPSCRAFFLPAVARVRRYGLARRTPAPIQSVALLRAHVGETSRAACV
jgi:hypothetical protein